jgi:hypothetical protein
MSKSRTCLWTALVLVLLLAGCSRGGQDVSDMRVDLAVDPSPPRRGVATVTAKLSDASGQPITGASVEFEGDMNHAGMVPVLAQAAEVAPGQYQASLEFTMAGDWFILVRAILSDGHSMEHQVDVPGVAP